MREEIRKNDRSNKKKSKFVTKELLFALEKKTYTSMMAPPGALFLSFSRFLRAFFSTGLESAYFPCVYRFASRFADGISKILSFFSLSFSLARRLSGRFPPLLLVCSPARLLGRHHERFFHRQFELFSFSSCLILFKQALPL